MKSKAVLLAAILVGMATLLAMIAPFEECPDCDGIIVKEGKTLVGHAFDQAFGCPRCDGRGRVSWINRLRYPPLDHYLKDMMLIPWRHPRNPDAFTAGVNRLAERTGVDRQNLTGVNGDQEQIWSGAAMFVRATDKMYVVAQLHADFFFTPYENGSPARLILFDFEGRWLDRLDLRRRGSQRMNFIISRAESEEGQLSIVPRVLTPLGASPDPVSLPLECEVSHAGRTSLIREAGIRVGILQGKFRILEPSRPRSP